MINDINLINKILLKIEEFEKTKIPCYYSVLYDNFLEIPKSEITHIHLKLLDYSYIKENWRYSLNYSYHYRSIELTDIGLKYIKEYINE